MPELEKHETAVDIFHVYNVFLRARVYKIAGGKTKIVATLNNYASFCPTGSAIYGCKSAIYPTDLNA